jgi:DNA primase
MMPCMFVSILFEERTCEESAKFLKAADSPAKYLRRCRRFRDGAPVTMPLTWGQVRSDLDPLRFTMHSVPAVLRKMSAWKDYCYG